MKKSIQQALCIFAVLMSLFCHSQETVNGSFETINIEHLPRDWTEVNTGNNYIIKADSLEQHSGRFSVMIDGSAYNSASADSNAVVYNGYGLSSSEKIKSIELSGWIKRETNIDSAAGIFVQSVMGDTTIQAFAHPSKINGQWQQVQVTFIPDNNKPWYGFYYGAENDGKARAWFDDITLKVNGKLVSDPAGATYEPGAANIRWLNANLHPLSSVDGDKGLTDMEAMSSLCNDATVVGIGEPTHGTSEALRFKLKLLQYLVTQKGFTTVVLEDNIATCDSMNAIINDSSAPIKESLLKLPFYQAWKSEEFAAMLQWIRDYNTTHARKVKFTGMDEEGMHIKMARQQLRDYGVKNSKNILNQMLKIDSSLQALLYADSSRISDSITTASAINLGLQLKGMDSLLNKEKKENILNRETFFTLETYVRICRQWLQVKFFVGDRDSCMADNIRYYTAFHPGDKLMIWAHNFHISNYSAGVKTMGAWLKQTFKEKYVPIGFTSSEGKYLALQAEQNKWNACSFEKAYQGTYEYILAKAKESLYFLSMKNNSLKQKEASWLRVPMKHLDIGYVKPDGENDYKYYGVLNSLFDGIVFCKTTSAAHSFMLTN